jgi:cytochrome c-type biogenesis protein
MIQNFIGGLENYLHGSLMLACLAVYLGGLLVSFTPCVYPVIPITVAYVGARSGGSRLKSFILSVVYVLGMSFTYTVLGGVAALTGSLFGRIQTNPWTFFIVANVCVLLGLSMLDLFNLPLPRLWAGAHPPSAGGWIAASFFVGAASGLVLGPCTAPVLAVLLTYVAASQNIVVGMLLLFLFAFGMGTLLIILGTFSGLLASLPAAGAWMLRMKRVFGWILIGMGEYFLIRAGTFMV